ncbi:hypothetical protein BDY17DRAFT_120620 [Neohortaea acidophila]|uniref:Cell wall proline rich protein n=1 Tax=Neohortaea acidophila TaxID=245834 RepID=A0A6A6PWE3_9PEZI|nr:uncharacterized protein BDY17DRAFT_120620 [Neohortaea acidophila]KAF2484061.1 hypothetical protein BDY17DRAFT_120620 [Neohortaea acidophila]
MAQVITPDLYTMRGESMDSANYSAVPSPTQPWTWQHTSAIPSRRPASSSMHIDIPSSAASSHRRTASTLPSFTFNAADTSGRRDSDDSPPRTPEDTLTTSPPRTGHRRGGSEFVGGDSRLGLSNVLSSSPTKACEPHGFTANPSVAAPGRRGHAHRRSAAISNHDVAKLMQPPSDAQPRLSSSLPTTPLDAYSVPPQPERSSVPAGALSDPFGPPLDSVSTRPPSRLRVGFSDNVEFIPRPLSTISSGTESSLSTVRGHSVNNSISSVLSLSTPSPPSSRTIMQPLRANLAGSPKAPAKVSFDSNRLVDKEGQWLKRRPTNVLNRPASDSGLGQPKTTISIAQTSVPSRKRASSHGFGVNRRRSEPTIGLAASIPSRLSTLSLQEPGSPGYRAVEAQECREVERKSSARKIRDWAASKISRKTKEMGRALMSSHSASSLRPVSAESGTSKSTDISPSEPPVAETDLDTVFSQQDTVEIAEPFASSHIEPSAYTWGPNGARRSYDDQSEAVLDLDAALGPFKTPSIASYRQRRELHSSRLTKDFSGPGGHYHRRAESAPNLSPFEMPRTDITSQAGMADVFEEEEEDPRTGLSTAKLSMMRSVDGKTSGPSVLNSDAAATGIPALHDDGLGIRGSLESDRVFALGSSRYAPPHLMTDGRGLSVAEETILEESPTGCEVEIVDAEEEPRASSLTKSSDSSDTPTVFAAPIGTLTLPDGQQSLMTPEMYQTSTFSSPAIGHGLFDHSRLDTAASSIMTDNRTLSSCTTGEYGQDLRISVDVPSLTSSRSTMISQWHGNGSRRDLSDAEPVSSGIPQSLEPTTTNDSKRKRSSIQSLSQLMGGTFGTKNRPFGDARPQTSTTSLVTTASGTKENRLKKLMFWKSKQRPHPVQRPALS